MKTYLLILAVVIGCLFAPLALAGHEPAEPQLLVRSLSPRPTIVNEGVVLEAVIVNGPGVISAPRSPVHPDILKVDFLNEEGRSVVRRRPRFEPPEGLEVVDVGYTPMPFPEDFEPLLPRTRRSLVFLSESYDATPGEPGRLKVVVSLRWDKIAPDMTEGELVGSTEIEVIAVTKDMIVKTLALPGLPEESLAYLKEMEYELPREFVEVYSIKGRQYLFYRNYTFKYWGFPEAVRIAEILPGSDVATGGGERGPWCAYAGADGQLKTVILGGGHLLELLRKVAVVPTASGKNATIELRDARIPGEEYISADYDGRITLPRRNIRTLNGDFQAVGDGNRIDIYYTEDGKEMKVLSINPADGSLIEPEEAAKPQMENPEVLP